MPDPAPKVNILRNRLKEEILRKWDDIDTIANIARSLNCGQNTVRRVLDSERPGERLARTEPKNISEKECSGCQQVLPLDAFPPRTDRPGALHARCQDCLRDWRRTYQHDNPERNREGVRRRRARLRAARTEPYRDEEVFDRDGGLCWFCDCPVDPELGYPDPMSGVVHHIHPIAKNGPDIVKNVALAHYSCNHRAKDSYNPPFTEWVVSPITYSVAKDLITTNHYTHRVGLVSYAFGLFDQEDKIMGVITFGSPPSNRITRSVTTENDIRILMLNRLWIDDRASFGAGTFFISRALKQLPASIIVSYADTEIVDDRYTTSHSGGIYRAASFNYSGTSRPNTEWRMPGQERNVGSKTEGAVPVRVSPKARYWTVTGTPSQRRMLREACLWPVVPYTKG